MNSIIISVALPLSLAVIMFSLGLGLTVADFRRVVTAPRAFLVGFAAQVVILPLTAYLLLAVAELPPPLAFGFMILAFCPGGATTNILTKFARGDVALSVTLTAVVSLLSVVTVPALVGFASNRILGAEAPPVDITSLALALFLIVTVPVLLGMAVRRFAPRFTDRAEPVFLRVAGVLFLIVLFGALAANWTLFVENVTILGPLLVGINILLLAVGFGLARLFGLGSRQASTIAIEGGVQNATLGITVAGLLTGTTMPDIALPSAVYGITMYLVTLPVVFLVFRRLSGNAQAA